MTQHDTTPSPEAILAALTILERASAADWSEAVEMMDGADERLQRVEDLSGALHALAEEVTEDINAVWEGEQKEAERSVCTREHAEQMFAQALHTAHIASMASAYAAQVEAAWNRHRALERDAARLPQSMDGDDYRHRLDRLV